MKRTHSSLVDLLPQRLEGWNAVGKDKIYHRSNLYDYIDGGAELYLSYDFRQVLARIYTAPEQPDILLDLFDMGASQNAFGVFSHSREVVEDAIGQGSQYTSGLLQFWKDRYFVSILAIPETEESKEAVFRLAKHIDAAIEKEGPIPKIVSLLPRESLIEESIRYFHHHAWLNSHYYVADENILHINENTEAVLAKYGDRSKPHILLFVKYPGENDSDSAYRDFVKFYMPELAQQTAVQIEDGTWTGCLRKESHLIVVFNATEERIAESLMKKVEKKLDTE